MQLDRLSLASEITHPPGGLDCGVEQQGRTEPGESHERADGDRGVDRGPGIRLREAELQDRVDVADLRGQSGTGVGAALAAALLSELLADPAIVGASSSQVLSRRLVLPAYVVPDWLEGP